MRPSCVVGERGGAGEHSEGFGADSALGTRMQRLSWTLHEGLGCGGQIVHNYMIVHISNPTYEVMPHSQWSGTPKP